MEDEAAHALLAVTDRRAAATEREPLKRAYQGLRGKAKDDVEQALTASAESSSSTRPESARSLM